MDNLQSHMTLLKQCGHMLVGWLGYCYITGREPYACVLGHMTGLLFCFYVKLFLPSILNSVDLRSSMSCIALDKKLADLNVIKQFGVTLHGNFQRKSLHPPKKYKSTKQTFWCTINLHGIVRNSACLDYSQLANIQM